MPPSETVDWDVSLLATSIPEHQPYVRLPDLLSFLTVSTGTPTLGLRPEIQVWYLPAVDLSRRKSA